MIHMFEEDCGNVAGVAGCALRTCQDSMLAILYDEAMCNYKVYTRYSYIERTLSQGVQIGSHSLERFGGRLAIRAAKFGPKRPHDLESGWDIQRRSLGLRKKIEGPL
jgi:hypothetical protein